MWDTYTVGSLPVQRSAYTPLSQAFTSFSILFLQVPAQPAQPLATAHNQYIQNNWHIPQYNQYTPQCNYKHGLISTHLWLWPSLFISI